MEISKINVAHFSPTYSTRDVARKMGEMINKNYHEIDLCDFDNRNYQESFSKNDLLIIAAPVYGGRIPNIAIERIKGLKGNDTPCIIVVTYGNREYDNALLELNDVATECGFKVVGATAIICTHSIVKEIASNRPNINDYDSIKVFIESVMEHLDRLNSVVNEKIYIPGDSKYIEKEHKDAPIKLHFAKKKCDECGVCVKMCPVNAIDKLNPAKIDASKCFSCMRCVKVCPKHAKEYSKAKYRVLRIYLKNNCEKGRKDEFYF